MTPFSDIEFEAGGIDRHWLEEWIAFGMAELDLYLEKVARFEQFIMEREAVR